MPRNSFLYHSDLLEDRWCNQACLGYCILAAEAVEIDSATVQKILSELHQIFDMVSVNDAKDYYQQSRF